MIAAESRVDRIPGAQEKNRKVQFILTGFTQAMGVRSFVFEDTAIDKLRPAYTVTADLALTRRYGIQVQELPLLCREMLERRSKDDQQVTIIFSEAEMKLHENTCKEARRAAILKRKPAHRPAPGNQQMGMGWRSPEPVNSLPVQASK